MQVLYNAKIYTNDPQRQYQRASTLVINNDRVIELGDEANILAEYGSKARLRDMQGKTIWPGLIDAHLHLENYSLGRQRIDCETPSLNECLARVSTAAARLEAGSWVLGHGWNQNVWPEGFGTAAMLDIASPHNPVYLTSKSIHSAWANSQALALAGITSETEDPVDGTIQRDHTGKATGILFETAMEWIEKVIPPPSLAQVHTAINQAQSPLWQVGLTGVHDYDQARCFSALQLLNQAGSLRLRVVKGIPLPDLPHAIAIGLRSGFGNLMLRVGSIKLFADGALGPRTAAMLAPYEDEGSNSGVLMLDSERILEYGQEATSHGLSLAIHAIGDRANHEVINAFESLRDFETHNNLPHLRHRIEHVQVLHPADYNRLAQLGIVASMQPLHATSDMLIADRYWGRRARHSYAWRSLLDNDTILAFGSDAPVEVPNPFLGLHAAVTRCRVDGSPAPQGWYPEQRLALAEALNAYTVGAAYAAGMEGQQGKLAPGYLADLIVLDVDPFIIPPEQLATVKPLATMVGGEWVWEA